MLFVRINNNNNDNYITSMAPQSSESKLSGATKPED